MNSAMEAWRGLRVIERVESGNRNEVWRGELDGLPVAVRRSSRSAASLEWELDVLGRVSADGVQVARVIVADDGPRSVDGFVVQEWVEGREPDRESDWMLVADALARVHGIDVEQRPGAKVVTLLTRTALSIDADLGALPDAVAEVVLDVFRAMHDVPTSLIHGDPDPSNIRIDADGEVWFLDWDESRVDLSWHDLSNLGVQVLDDDQHLRAGALSHAWEAINGWTAEPAYARRRYAQLLALINSGRLRR